MTRGSVSGDTIPFFPPRNFSNGMEAVFYTTSGSFYVFQDGKKIEEYWTIY